MGCPFFVEVKLCKLCHLLFSLVVDLQALGAYPPPGWPPFILLRGSIAVSGLFAAHLHHHAEKLIFSLIVTGVVLPPCQKTPRPRR